MLTSICGLLLVGTRCWWSRARIRYFQRRVALRSADYVVSGVLAYTLITSCVAHVRNIKSWLVSSPTTLSALLLVRLAVDGMVAMRGAGALRTLVPDFMRRDGMPRADVHRSHTMVGKWWAIAFSQCSQLLRYRAIVDPLRVHLC